MRQLLWNLFLAVIWMSLWGNLSIPIFAWGFLLGFVVIYLSRSNKEAIRYTRKSVLWIRFVTFFIWEFLLSALRIIHEILTYKSHMCPGVLAVPLDIKTETGILFYANVISLTPGTLSLDVSEDGKYLYVHFMYIDKNDIESSRYLLKQKFESKILELFK